MADAVPSDEDLEALRAARADNASTYSSTSSSTNSDTPMTVQNFLRMGLICVAAVTFFATLMVGAYLAHTWSTSPSVSKHVPAFIALAVLGVCALSACLSICFLSHRDMATQSGMFWRWDQQAKRRGGLTELTPPTHTPMKANPH